MSDQLGVTIRMSDGVNVSVRVYKPEGDGLFPTLFAASPYRYDNDDVPPTMVFFWHEVGPIRWYVERGYAYVHLDVRGSGRSEGEYGFFNRRERRDLYETIEWIASQPWSNGKVGGIGQSYYSAAQWCMAAERPPHLTCIAPYDGHMDFYRGWVYPGGIQGYFAQVWWNGSVRIANKFPANGVQPRDIPYDLVHDIMEHPLVDAFWEDRSLDEQLAEVTIPVYSIGVWVKRDLHLAGNIRGYHLVKGPKKLMMSGVPTLPQALAEFASTEFHQKTLAPFYDHYLKGEDTDYQTRAPVEYFLNGANIVRNDTEWPPAGVREHSLYLKSGPSGTVTSLNDGSLAASREGGESSTSYSYPDAQWAIGSVALTRRGPDPVRRVVTYTSPPLKTELTLAGAPIIVLHLSTTRTDANVIAKLSVQQPQSDEDRRADINPTATVLAKGWLRASQRALDPSQSLGGEPYLAHKDRAPLVPGTVYELVIEMTHMAYRFAAGNRIRLELCCSDSTVTDLQFNHIFTPDMVGTDTFHHDTTRPSRLILPVLEGWSF
jgi:putative CocE/NonD family hydrolase